MNIFLQGDGGGDRRHKRSGSVHSSEDESNIPEQDYKRYRKKHNNVSFDEFTAYLGALGTFIEVSTVFLVICIQL